MERKWTQETEAEIERRFGREYPMDDIRGAAALVAFIAAGALADDDGVLDLDDRAKMEKVLRCDPKLDAYYRPPRNAMLPALIDCAIILAADPVYVEYLKGVKAAIANRS
jgi:hypothetical protein